MALDARRRSLTGTLLWLCILSDIVCLALPTSPEPAGLSLEVREDGVRGYWYETADHVGVGAVAFDPNGKVLYLTAYDPATGHDVVVQVDPRDRRGNGDGARTRGWDSRGPRRVATAPLEPDAGFCGASHRGQGSVTFSNICSARVSRWFSKHELDHQSRGVRA